MAVTPTPTPTPTPAPRRRRGPAAVLRLPYPRLAVPALVVYALAVYASNELIAHVGATLPGNPSTHYLPVGFGLLAPSGAYAAALVLVARDVVQRVAGRGWSLVIIVPASVAVAALDPRLALASGSAFLLAELLDFAVYTPLQRRSLGWAVLLSSLAGAVLDSVWFLLILGAPLALALPGLLLAKGYVAVLGGVLVGWLRRWLPTPLAAPLAARRAPVVRMHA